MTMLEHCPSIAKDALLQAFRFSNARTYARTHKELWLRESLVLRKSARAGGRTIFPQMVKVSASASRGQDVEVSHA